MTPFEAIQSILKGVAVPGFPMTLPPPVAITVDFEPVSIDKGAACSAARALPRNRARLRLTLQRPHSLSGEERAVSLVEPRLHHRIALGLRGVRVFTRNP